MLISPAQAAIWLGIGILACIFIVLVLVVAVVLRAFIQAVREERAEQMAKSWGPSDKRKR